MLRNSLLAALVRQNPPALASRGGKCWSGLKVARESAGHPAARSRGRYPGGPRPARGHSRWPRKSGPCPCSGSACPHREDAGVAWQGLGRCARRKAEAVSIYRLLHRARRSCRGACCPPQRSGSFFLAISGINSKGMANQALEQARNCVLSVWRAGESRATDRGRSLAADPPAPTVAENKKPLRRPLLSAHRRGFRSRGSGRSRTDDGGFAIRCLSHLATEPFSTNINQPIAANQQRSRYGRLGRLVKLYLSR